MRKQYYAAKIINQHYKISILYELCKWLGFAPNMMYILYPNG